MGNLKELLQMAATGTRNIELRKKLCASKNLRNFLLADLP